MQTPSSVATLDLDPASDTAQTDGLDIAESLQKIVRYDLKEEGNHILAVSVSYTENRIGENAHVASGRVRTFRKLYQFVAQPCLSVRTKASELPPLEVDNKSLGPYGKTRLLRFALEAQLENVGDGAVVVKVSIPQLDEKQWETEEIAPLYREQRETEKMAQGTRNKAPAYRPLANTTQSQTTLQMPIPQLGCNYLRSHRRPTNPQPTRRPPSRLPHRTRRKPRRRSGGPTKRSPPRRPRRPGPIIHRVARRHG